MRAVVQRVLHASVRVEERTTGSIGAGLVVLLGVAVADREDDARHMAEKVANLRIFPDEAGLMNRSVLEIGADMQVELVNDGPVTILLDSERIF